MSHQTNAAFYHYKCVNCAPSIDAALPFHVFFVQMKRNKWKENNNSLKNCQFQCIRSFNLHLIDKAKIVLNVKNVVGEGVYDTEWILT